MGDKIYNVMKNIVFKILPYIIIVIILLFWTNTCNRKKDQDSLITVLNDSLYVTRNSLGQQVASIEVFQTENKKQFLQLQSKDLTIISLQRLVKKTKNLQNAIVLNNSTSNSVNGTTTSTSRDTIRNDSLVYIYPEYSFNRSTQWDSVSIKSNKDSTHLEYKIFNKFDITTSYKRLGLFKGKVPIIDIVNKNPYTETIALRAYEVKCDCKRGRFFLGGVSIGISSVLLTNKFLIK